MSKLKRLAAPPFWPIEVKTKKYVVKPMPGPHSLKTSIPLGVLLRDILKYAETMKESKQILYNGVVKVDGKVRKEHSFPVGLMDIVEIDNEIYRILANKKGLYLKKIEKKELFKLARIEDKQYLKGTKLQLNLHDGKNMVVGKDEYKTGDVLVLDLNNKIKQTLKFNVNAVAMIISGRNIGEIVTIKKIIITKSPQPNIVVVDLHGSEVPVPKDYIFVLGIVKPVISV